jgi:hypothetical protein
VLDSNGRVVTVIRNGKRVPKMERIERPKGWERNTAKLPDAERAEGFRVVEQRTYARPRRIGSTTMKDKDGNSIQVPNMVWQRRTDFKQANRHTTGDMLKAGSAELRREVLGSRKMAEAFKALTGPGGRFHGDPQGAVIELLRPGGVPAGAHRRRPVT